MEGPPAVPAHIAHTHRPCARKVASFPTFISKILQSPHYCKGPIPVRAGLSQTQTVPLSIVDRVGHVLGRRVALSRVRFWHHNMERGCGCL